MNQAQCLDARDEQVGQDSVVYNYTKPLLQAKGTCWYCDKTVDNVRKFCSMSCRENYYEEENEMG